jgi:hypothetical protein
MDFSDVAEMDGFTIWFPIPEAYFFHKLIIARKRSSGAKRGKDLEQCTAIMQVINKVNSNSPLLCKGGLWGISYFAVIVHQS